MVSVLVSINYLLGIESRISIISQFSIRFMCFFLMYAVTFISCYFIHFTITKNYIPVSPAFKWLLFIAPALFALKISSHQVSAPFTASLNIPWNKVWQILLDWPIKAVLMIMVIYICWKLFGYKNPVAGMTIKNFSLKPYIVLILLLIPFIFFAATTHDFSVTYPKLKNIFFIKSYTDQFWKYALLYELSYGSDFFSIELFFRGFVVLAFVRFVGKDAILPMAAFYCSIHFGKPLFECITSYFGGIILGAIVYRTQSVWGGLVAHLGIAWMMEIAGYGARISDS